jgi:hypothetical protein
MSDGGKRPSGVVFGVFFEVPTNLRNKVGDVICLYDVRPLY